MRRCRLFLLHILLGLFLCASLAATGIADLLDERQATMKQIARSFEPMAQMYKRLTFDAATVAAQSNEVAADLQRFRDLFPAGSEKADTASSPKIWTDRAGFEKAQARAYAAAVALSKVTDQGGFRDAVQRLGDACTACHHAYRLRD